MGMNQYVQGPGYQLDIPKEYRRVQNLSGATLVVGQVVMFDLLGATVTDSVEEYNANRIEGVVKQPATIGCIGPTGSGAPALFWFAIVTDLLDGEASTGTTPGADTMPVKVLVRGRVKATYVDSATDVVVGDAMFAVNGAYTLTNIAPARGKVIGIACEATAAAGDFWTLFDGIYGWGHAT